MWPVDFAFYFSYSIGHIYHVILKSAFDTNRCLSGLKMGKGGAPGEMELGSCFCAEPCSLGHCGVVCSQTTPCEQPGAVTGHWVLQHFWALWNYIALDLWAFRLDSQSRHVLLGCGCPPIQMCHPTQGNPGYCLKCCPGYCLKNHPRGCLRVWWGFHGLFTLWMGPLLCEHR